MINKSPVRLLGAAVLAASLFATSACSDPASGDSGGGSENVSLVGFSILKTANKDLVAGAAAACHDHGENGGRQGRELGGM